MDYKVSILYCAGSTPQTHKLPYHISNQFYNFIVYDAINLDKMFKPDINGVIYERMSVFVSFLLSAMMISS